MRTVRFGKVSASAGATPFASIAPRLKLSATQRHRIVVLARSLLFRDFRVRDHLGELGDLVRVISGEFGGRLADAFIRHGGEPCAYVGQSQPLGGLLLD